MKRRLISVMLFVALLMTSFTIPALADETTESPKFEGTLRISEEGIAMIQDLEGFIETPIWDVAQYSVGYGCSSTFAEKYGFDPTRITKEEAHQLMLFVLDEMEDSLDSFLNKNNIIVSQQQYDALMSFTYNLGKGSINGTSRIGKLLLDGSYTTNQLASAFGIYCHTGTGKNAVIQDHLVSRRIREAKLFLYGAYDFDDVEEKFCRLTYLGNIPSGFSDVALYQKDEPYQILFDPDPSSEYAADGEYFIGWYNVDTFEKVTASTIVTESITVFPVWSDMPEDPELLQEADDHIFTVWTDLTEKTYINGVIDGEAPTEGEEEETPSVEYVEASTLFSDLYQDQWYYGYVNDLVNAGIINGYEDQTFRPENKVTTGEALKMILLSTGYSMPEQVTDHWASGYHYQALDYAIIDRGDITDLDVPITRGMMAKVVANAMGLNRIYDGDPYTDTANLYASILYDWGITEGYEDGTFRPDRALTRAELSTIVWRIHKVYE